MARIRYFPGRIRKNSTAERAVRHFSRIGAGEAFCGGGSTYYDIFPGVMALVHRLVIDECVEAREASNALEINFCANGRFESDFSDRDCAILGPGDAAVSLFDGKNGRLSRSRFPLGYYEGLTIHIDCAAATAWLRANFPALGLDLCALRDQLLSEHWFWTGSAGGRCEHVFRELLELLPYGEERLLQLKTAELLLLLPQLCLRQRESAYVPRSQVELVQHIRDHIVSDRSSYSSVEQLAREHGLSVTQLQRVFRRLYGMPIYQYLKEYRLEQSAIELIQTSRPVTQIALDAGFSSASKFSETFKKRYGMTPSAYRIRSYDQNGMF